MPPAERRASEDGQSRDEDHHAAHLEGHRVTALYIKEPTYLIGPTVAPRVPAKPTNPSSEPNRLRPSVSACTISISANGAPPGNPAKIIKGIMNALCGAT